MKNILVLSFFAAVLSACGSDPMKLPPAEGSIPPEAPPVAVEEPTRIDYIGLQQTLGLDRADENLGYVEKAFDTCKAGNGFSHSENCHKEYFVLLHFQLKCRETDEAPQDGVSAMDTHPIANHAISWVLEKKKGVVQTDSQGYGQIRASYMERPGTKHIKLASDTHFLYVIAKELDRIVTPPIWCQ